MKKVGLVVGASGIAGTSIASLLDEQDDWEVIELSRRHSRTRTGTKIVSVDLTSAKDCRRAARRLAGVTHIFYAARSPASSLEDETRTNFEMLRNLVNALDVNGAPLQHINLVHGTKWYGSNHYAGYEGYDTPAREDHPRHDPPNFYHLQQDFLEERQRNRDWSWSTVRPHTIWGFALGYPHNFPLLLAAYALITRHLGQPLCFPGSKACYDSVSQATDARLLSRAMLWAATNPRCANQAFNVVNSDYFRWRSLWPKIAEYFGMEAGPVRTARMVEYMQDKEALWDEIAAAHGLRRIPFASLGNWNFFDGVVRSDSDDMSSTVKLRRFGFDEIAETDEMCFNLFDKMRTLRVIS